MKVNIPISRDDLTIEWLSAVLGFKVTSCVISPLEGGVLSDAYQFGAITYDAAPPDAPISLVVKIANKIKELRDFGMAVNAFNKELNFFRYLSTDMPIAVPHCYGCDTDGSPGAEFFYIVMEDLSQHSKVFDQVDDPPDERFARKMALEAARLHAKYWNSDITRLPWVGSPDGRYAFSLDPWCRAAHTSWELFRTLYQQMYGHEFFSPGNFAAIQEMTEILCGRNSIAILNKIFEVLSSRPKTLLHGDARADNLFRTDPSAGLSVDDSVLTFIDWQLLHAGPPGPEFSQAWFSSLEPEVRKNDRMILKEYHVELVRLNPEAAPYSYEMLLQDYAFGCVIWWMALISLATGAFPSFDKPEGARSKQLWGRGLARVRHALTELGCPELVQRIQAEIA